MRCHVVFRKIKHTLRLVYPYHRSNRLLSALDAKDEAFESVSPPSMIAGVMHRRSIFADTHVAFPIQFSACISIHSSSIVMTADKSNQSQVLVFSGLIRKSLHHCDPQLLAVTNQWTSLINAMNLCYDWKVKKLDFNSTKSRCSGSAIVSVMYNPPPPLPVIRQTLNPFSSHRKTDT